MAVRYQDYYQTLGVARDADERAIQQAYRKLARKHHPDVDKSPGAEERFKQINEAYEVLKDREKRARYDALGANWQGGQEFTPPSGFGGAGGPHFDFEGFGDSGFSSFFESLFGDLGGGAHFGGARGHGRRARRGRTQESEITLSLEEVFHGGTHDVVLVGTDERGQRGAERTLSIKLPPGTTEGTAIRLAGQGEPGRGGGEPGDLILRVRVAPHARWRVEAHDLATRVEISPWEAALGARVPLRLLAGEATVGVPAGSQSGSKLRLRGQGLTRRDGSRGDVLVELAVAVPTELTPRERELFESLARESRFDPRR
jgi:curved DNA-binding protein